MILPVRSLLGLDDEPSMLTMLEGGPSLLEMLSDQVAEWIERHSESASLPVDETVPVWQAALQPPLPNPPSIRDFYAFEQHVAAGYARRNRPIPPAWYQMPVFYFGHTGDLFGPDQPVPYPVGTSQLDFELEIACVIGSHGRDIAPDRAFQHIAGFIILNDWSARDIQATEMSVGLGPAKGKDFATSIGPALVTLDDLEDRLVDDRLALDVSVSVNGLRLSSSNTREMHWSWGDLIATASRNVVLRPGDIIASGTVPGGCLLELGEAVHPWLVPDDVVELDVERLGRLRSTVGEVAP
jgi:2-keto-4-pentenoate hydratase/2-oxohepta-3-ene-1,7-dioic acid hydratase in catechol pathway